jgi:pimeloyl-ACP methyl ester carboxylesterase
MNVLNTVQRYIRRRLVAAGASSELYDVEGYRVHAYRLAGTGQGPPVVLVHGLAGSANGFARILVPLARRFSAVYALDLPGNGFSPLPASGPLTLQQMLEVLHAFCGQVVQEPAFVVGNSLGGAFALMLAGEHPGDVAALGLLAPAGARLAPEEFAEMMQRLDVQTVGDALRLTRRLFHKAPFLALLFAPEMKKLHATPAVRALRQMLRPDDHVPSDVLGRLAAPILLLWGGSEKLLLPQMLAYYRTHLPHGTRIEVVKGFGHVPQMERPREVVARLTRFADETRL